MFVALVVLNVVHPGAIMPGKDGDMPGRKERKRLEKRGKDLSSEESASRGMYGRQQHYEVGELGMQS